MKDILFYGSMILSPLGLLGQILVGLLKNRYGFLIIAAVNIALCWYNVVTGQPFWLMNSIPAIFVALVSWYKWGLSDNRDLKVSLRPDIML